MNARFLAELRGTGNLPHVGGAVVGFIAVGFRDICATWFDLEIICIPC